MSPSCVITNGKLKHEQELDVYVDLTSVLSLLKYRTEHLRITALKDEGTGGLIPVSSVLILPASDLEDGHTYSIVHEDLREKKVRKLSPEQLAKIKADFRKLDIDGSGTISVCEFQQFQEKMARMEIEAQINSVLSLQKKKLPESQYKAFEQKLLERKEMQIQRRIQMNQSLIQNVHEIDVNGDGEISLQEYIAARAMLL